MQDYFEHEITQAKKELTRLKTSAQKSSSNARIIVQQIPISVDLQWENISYPYGSARAEIFYEIIPENNAIYNCTLDWYSGDITQAAVTTQPTREIKLTQHILPNGSEGVRLYFIGTEDGANSDAARVKNGETVTINVTLTISCTDVFTARVYNV